MSEGRFWNGKELVTKDELLNFFDSQFKYWGAFQVWTDKPDHFLEADYTPVIYVVMYSMDDQFWSVPLNECLSNDDTESYGVVRVESISTLPYVDLTGYTLIWEDGEWKHAYQREGI